MKVSARDLRLETGGGSLSVNVGPDGVVKLVAREKIRANSDAEADELLRDLDLKMEQSGNDIRGYAKYNGARKAFSFMSSNPVQVSFVATVPASYAAELKTSGGGIQVADLQGRRSVPDRGCRRDAAHVDRSRARGLALGAARHGGSRRSRGASRGGPA